MPRAGRSRHSYGIALVRYNEQRQKLEFFAVKRRTTFDYINFVTCTGPVDETQLLGMLNRMTVDEKLDLLSLDFRRIYYRISMQNPEHPDRRRRYDDLHQAFRARYTRDGGAFLRRLVQQSANSSGIWEIPKGRKQSSRELDLNCAIREFGEETGLHPDSYYLLPVPTVTLRHLSEDSVLYESTYTFACLDDQAAPSFAINYSNRAQLAEVAAMQWVSREGAEYLDPSGRLSSAIALLTATLKRHYRPGHLVSGLSPNLKLSPPPAKPAEVERLACTPIWDGRVLPTGVGDPTNGPGTEPGLPAGPGDPPAAGVDAA